MNFIKIFYFTQHLLNDIITFVLIKYPPVAQLDNAVDSDSKERGFESLRAGHKERDLTFCLISFFI